MASLYTQQNSNVVKTYFLFTLFFVLISALGYFLAFYYGDAQIFYFAIIFSLILNFASYWWSDKITLSLNGAREASRQEFFDLYTTVENLAITAGLPMPKVYIIEDSAPNAFATGRDKNHAVVAVTTGLLNRLEKVELEGVIAHELSHIGNRDILLMSVVVVLVGLISIISDIFLRSSWRRGLRNDREDRNGGVLMIVGIVLMLLSPLIATLIKLAISRRREYLADASGALLTRYPEGLAKALEKIASYGEPMKQANTATAHLFISNPFGANKNTISNLFQTHPPIAERIKILRSM